MFDILGGGNKNGGGPAAIVGADVMESRSGAIIIRREENISMTICSSADFSSLPVLTEEAALSQMHN